MRATEIAKLLARQAEDVARKLLPNGKRHGREWKVGSVGGDAGESLGVCLSGDRAGAWADFSTGDTGDLIGLWMAVENLDLREACEEAIAYLGVAEHRVENPKPAYKRPTKENVSKLSDEHYAWLTEVRMIAPATIAAYKLATKATGRGIALMFPYLRDGELLAAKYRGAPEKTFWTDAECEPCLFGWQAVPAAQRELVLCEGELDALAWHTFGHAALSVPFGGGGGNKQQWVPNEFDRLARYDVLYLSMDMDKSGQEAVAELVSRLGRERCRIVELPRKDANQCLIDGFTVEDMAAAKKRARTLDPAELRNAGEFEDAVWAEFTRVDEGLRLPWRKTHDSVILRAGETSIWAGTNGHGKALSLGTKIPTPSGWSTMGDLKPGDWVFDENGVPCEVVAQTPVMLGRPVFKVIFSDGSEIVADAEHEWLTFTAKARQSFRNAKKNNRLEGRTTKRFGNDQSHKRTKPSIVTTRQIAGSVFVVGGCWDGLSEHSIQVSGPLQCGPVELPVDPYLLGVWLGDGTSASSTITTADAEIIDSFTRAEHVVTKLSSPYSYGITGGHFFRGLKAARVLGNKHIPAAYLRASFEQRLALLQGLMDTDGSVTTYGRCEFTNTNKRLADAVLELVLSLGIQAKMVGGRAMLYGKDCGPKYRITFTPNLPVATLPRKAARLRNVISDRVKHRFIVGCQPMESVPVKCIQVNSKSHMYLAGETMIPTHNSAVVSHIVASLACDAVRCCVASMEFRTAKWLMRMARQIAARSDPTEIYVRHIVQCMAESLWTFDVAGRTKADRILEVFDYARRRYGIELFVLDNLTKCGFADDDYAGQKAFVETLTDFARDARTHVAIVAHMRKGESEDKPSGKFGVKGSGGVIDMCDTLVEVWRNKKREAAIRTAKETGNPIDPDYADQADTMLYVRKQRETGIEPAIKLWFDPDSTQFLAKADHRALPLLNRTCVPVQDDGGADGAHGYEANVQ
jgi:twinkle protein